MSLYKGTKDGQELNLNMGTNRAGKVYKRVSVLISYQYNLWNQALPCMIRENISASLVEPRYLFGQDQKKPECLATVQYNALLISPQSEV